MKQQTVSSSNSTTASPSTNDITLEGIKFRVMDGGKKLFRLPGASPVPMRSVPDYLQSADDVNAGLVTPKTAMVAGVKFHRTKTGNFVANRVLKDQRYVPHHHVGVR